MPPDKERAKRIILEILRHAGELGKTKLFKAFWLSHLYYCKAANGYLSDWPIVRMPNGPGIDRAEMLLSEMVRGEFLSLTHLPKGPFTEINCRLSGKPIEGDLGPSAAEAIRKAVADVKTCTAEEISELSHELSRSWKNTPNGSELDIYSDLIPDDVYDERRQELMVMKKTYESLFERYLSEPLPRSWSQGAPTTGSSRSCFHSDQKCR